MKKKIFTFVLSIAAILLISGCGPAGGGEQQGGQAAQQVDGQATAEQAQQETLQVSILYNDNPSFPFRSDWLVLNEIRERQNVELEFMVVPNDDYGTRMRILLHAGDAPDIIMPSGKETEFALNGAFLPISDHYALMPNFTALTVGLERDMQNLYEMDGNLYVLPRLHEQGGYVAGLAIRLDILEALGLDTPTTMDELYHVMTVMKEAHPDSWPLTGFWGTSNLLTFLGRSWDFTHITEGFNVSFNWNDDRYEASATSSTYREMLMFINRLYEGGLLDPELMTQNLDQWTAKVTTGRSFMTFCWGDQLESINAVGMEHDPNFNMQLIHPVNASTQIQFRQTFNYAEPIFAINSNVANRPDLERFITFVDWWLYSEEGVLLTNWGVEGETFVVQDDGSITFSEGLLNAPHGATKQAQIDYGLFTWQLCGKWRYDRYVEYMGPEAAIISDEMNRRGQFRSSVPAPMLSIYDIEHMQVLSAPIRDTVERATEAFILGQMDFYEDWENFVNDLNARGMQEIVDMHNSGIGR